MTLQVYFFFPLVDHSLHSFSDISVLRGSFALWLVMVNIHLGLMKKIQCTWEITMTIISRIIPNVWSVLWSHGYQDPNQSESKKVKESPYWSCFLNPSELLLSLNFPRGVSPCAACGIGHSTNTCLLSWKIIKGYPIIKTTLSRESREFLLGSYYLSSRFRYSYQS